MKLTTAALVMLSLAGIVVGVAAQQRGAPRTILQRADLSLPSHEVITAVADFQPGAATGRHAHPGEMVGYILEGTSGGRARGPVGQNSHSGSDIHHSVRNCPQQYEQ